jgi:GNAT superfamily N-acetyltransferase
MLPSVAPLPPTVALDHHPAEDARAVLDELCDAYADAYGVKQSSEKTTAFRDRTLRQLDRQDFDLVTARAANQLVGFAFGYTLPADTRWWEGLDPDPGQDFRTETGGRTFVLSEIEVRRAWQNKSVGRALHDDLLRGRHAERATLATGPDAASQSVYQSWGWTKAGRVPGVDGEYYSAYDLFVISLPLEPYP